MSDLFMFSASILDGLTDSVARQRTSHDGWVNSVAAVGVCVMRSVRDTRSGYDNCARGRRLVQVSCEHGGALVVCDRAAGMSLTAVTSSHGRHRKLVFAIPVNCSLEQWEWNQR